MKNSENHKNEIADKITITVKTLVFITGVFFVCWLIRFPLSVCNNSYAFTKLVFLRNMGEVFWLCFVEIIDKLLINIHKLEIDCNIAVFVDKNRVNEFT